MTELENCVESIRRLAERLDGHFPRPNPQSPNGKYLTSQGGFAHPWQWTDAFWPGQLRLCYHITGDSYFRDQADRLMPKLWGILKPGQFGQLVYFGSKPPSHDLGFFGMLSGDEKFARACADAMLTLYDEKRGFIRSWPQRPDCIIIDSTMTTHLLWQVSESDDDKYTQAARNHFNKLQHLVRENGSTYHVGWFDADGEWVKGTTHQGLNDNSCWSRGQAWAIAGGLAPYWTGKYWSSHTPGIPPYDFSADWSAPRDSSAAAIYADATGDKEVLALLTERWSVAANTEAEGLLTGGCIGLTGPITRGQLPYGDYYYLSALYKANPRG